MKYIVIGLGNYGTALASKLTTLGHEVIAVDSEYKRVEAVKDLVTHAVNLQCTDIHALQTLPLQDTDIVIVAIGEDFGASIYTTTLLKQLKVKKIICRAISPIHQHVLEALGIREIVNPEEDSAYRLVKKMEMKDIVDYLDISEDYSIIEILVPKQYIGLTVREADFRKRYNINIITVKRTKEIKNVIGVPYKKSTVLGVLSSDLRFEEDDILVLYGNIKDIRVYLKNL
jgi:trk system potassium uptake protein TrkA